MLYNIMPSNRETDIIYVPRELFNKYNDGDLINLSVGIQKHSVRIIKEQELTDSIKISQDVLRSMSIPVDIKYQLIVTEGNIQLGPVIGLLMANKNRTIEKKLATYLDYAKVYQNFQGLLLLFGLDGIDVGNQNVKGYYYHLDQSSTGGGWKRGVFPFPSVIYRRVTLPKYQVQKLKALTANKVFNSYYFNKWSFWQMASRSEVIRKYLPHTRRLLSIGDLDQMLGQYNEVYLKPVSGTLARGLIKAYREKGKYCFKSNDSLSPIKISSGEVAAKYIKRLLANEPYLVQQAIKSLKFENRHTDYRVIMQKDCSGVWQCPIIIGRVGKVGGICSNFMECGYACECKELLSHFLLSKRKIKKIKRQIINVCIKVCRFLDLTGENYGDLGFDVTVDEKFRIWVLEVNKQHDHDLILTLKNCNSYLQIKSNPVEYAVALGGFEVKV